MAWAPIPGLLSARRPWWWHSGLLRAPRPAARRESATSGVWLPVRRAPLRCLQPPGKYIVRMMSFLVSSMLPSTALPGSVAACAWVLAVIGVVAWLAPGFPRGLFFSVAVQPWLSLTPEGLHILWWYRIKVALHTLIGFVLLVLPYVAAC